MSNSADLTKLFSDFVAEEDAVFPQAQGRFWPSNHHRITPALAELPAVLPREARERFYFHYLRVSADIPPVAQPEFELLVAAYRELLPSIDQAFPNLCDRLDTLFAFGFDDAGALTSGATVNAKELATHVHTLKQATRYASLPGQRVELDRFAPFASEAQRILETFRHLGYQLAHPGAGQYTSHRFWGLALMVLLSESHRGDFVYDMRYGAYDIADRQEYLRILDETLLALD